MARAKTIKKAGSPSEEHVTIKKKVAKNVEKRTYSMTETYEKGDIIHHTAWDDVGEVIEVGITDDGINKISVAFEKVGLKKLRAN